MIDENELKRNLDKALEAQRDAFAKSIDAAYEFGLKQGRDPILQIKGVESFDASNRNDVTIYHTRESKGTLDIFGERQIIVDLSIWPNRWVRLWATVFFNSKWEKKTHD